MHAIYYYLLMRKTVITLAYFFICLAPFRSVAQNWSTEEIVNQLKVSTNTKTKAELYYQLAKLKIGTEIDSAFYYADVTIEKARSIKSKPILAKAYFLIGYLYEITDDVPNALQYYVGAKRVYEDLGNISRVEDLDENLFKIAQDYDALEAAEFFASNRLNYLDDLPDFRRRADVYFDLGLVYFQDEEYIKANNVFWKALFEYQEHATLRDTVGYSHILLRLGMVQKKSGNTYQDQKKYYDSAEYFYRKAKAMNGSPINQIWYHNNMGSLLIDRQQHEEAFNYLTKALKLEKQHQTVRMLPLTYNNFGLIFFKKGELDSAHHYFKQAVVSNISTKTPLKNIYDKTHSINFYNHDELEKSLSYMDSIYWQNPLLTPLDESVTAQYYKDHLLKQAALRNLKEEYIMSVALKENMLLSDKLTAKLRREKMINWGGVFALVLAVSIAIRYWIRLKRTHASMDEMFDYLDELEDEKDNNLNF